MDAAQAWDDCRQRISDLAIQPGAAQKPCPACPDWDVKGVVSHLTGIAAAMVGGASAGQVNTDHATADQVAVRADVPVEQVVAEWASHAPAYVDRLRDPAGHGLDNAAVLLSVMDIAAHEHDIRYPLDQPGHRDSFAVELGTKVLVAGLKARQAAHTLSPLRVEVPGWRTWDIGGEQPRVTLTTDRFTLFRSLSGRRTRAQVEGLDWTGDNADWLDQWLAGAFSWSTTEHEA